jgi:transcriptional regulator
MIIELKMEMPNVKRSRKNALKKIERAKADLEFVNGLNSQRTSAVSQTDGQNF